LEGYESVDKGRRTVVEVREDLHREIRKLASLNDLRIYELTNAMLEDYLKNQEKVKALIKRLKLGRLTSSFPIGLNHTGTTTSQSLTQTTPTSSDATHAINVQKKDGAVADMPSQAKCHSNFDSLSFHQCSNSGSSLF